MFALEKSLVYIVNSITSNGALLERMKAMAEKLGFNADQVGVLDDLIIENQQVCGGLISIRKFSET